MKKIITLTTLTTLFISCGPSLPDVAQIKLDQQSTKKSISYYSVKNGKLKSHSLKPEQAELIDEIDLTPKEEVQVSESIAQAAMLGAKDYDFELSKYNMKLSYKSPEDGFVTANNRLYSSKEAFELDKKTLVHQKTHRQICVYKSWAGCKQYRQVKVDGADKIEADLNKGFADFKVLKKGEIAFSNEYITSVSEESAGGQSQFRVHLKKVAKRDIASVK